MEEKIILINDEVNNFYKEVRVLNKRLIIIKETDNGKVAECSLMRDDIEKINKLIED